MLDHLFLAVLNMSFTASYIILFVILARLLLQKAPKIFSYSLWSVVLFRLVCPFSFESILSIFSITGRDIHDIRPFPTGIRSVPPVETVIQYPNSTVVVMPLERPPFELIFTAIWLLGIIAMAVYSIVSYSKQRRSLATSTPLKDNIYLADHISTAFVLGIIKPKIHLPSSLLEAEQSYIILHEKCHIKRLDHLTRILGFIALSVHWFNPLVWIAFILSGRDMELSCDEAVMKSMNTDIKAEYSQSLLRFSTTKKMIHATPLAFGEGDTKDRVKNVLNYKKPKFWIVLITALLCVVAVFCLVSNPISKTPPTLYAYSENGVIPMNLGSYSWNGTVADTISYTEMEYDSFISYNDGYGHRNANIFFSTSNTPSEFNTDNAKGTDEFEIVEMVRFVDGKEEILDEFGGNMILVSLEQDTTYLYAFKVQFGENHAYYSIKINNNVPNSANVKNNLQGTPTLQDTDSIQITLAGGNPAYGNLGKIITDSTEITEFINAFNSLTVNNSVAIDVAVAPPSYYRFYKGTELIKEYAFNGNDSEAMWVDSSVELVKYHGETPFALYNKSSCKQSSKMHTFTPANAHFFTASF